MVTKILEKHTTSICRAEGTSILKTKTAAYSEKLTANQKATQYYNPVGTEGSFPWGKVVGA
jgi:hypothetical protein